MKSVIRILTIFILPLFIIGGLNYYFDPDYTLRKAYIPPLVKALAEGEMVSGPININSRLMKKLWISTFSKCPEILVLGSSRTLNLTHESFPGKSFFNASVTNCTFQDMYAFLNLVEEKQNDLPETVIICVDQWLFGHAFSEERWLTNRSDFVDMAKKVGDIPLSVFPSKWKLEKEWIKELFSVRYLARSLRYHGKIEKFQITQSIDPGTMMFLPDGARHLPVQLVNSSESEVLKKATDYFFSSKDEYFTELDPIQIRLFERMIRYLKQKNCNVLLFIPPYHPETFELFEQSSKANGIFKATNYVLMIAKEHRIHVIGNTDPKRLNLTQTDFYDGVHLKPKALSGLFVGSHQFYLQ